VSVFLSFALRYAAHGWSVLPIKPRDKVPASRGGVKDATRDAVRIRAWWAEWPDANVAIAAGPSGLAIVDIDPRNGGLESMRDLVAAHRDDFPQTPVAMTGGGGWHYLYSAPPGVVLLNGGPLRRASRGVSCEECRSARLDRRKVDRSKCPCFWHGVDLKSAGQPTSAGGYIVAPPSIHPSGHEYAWASSARPSAVPCAPLPSWLVDLARASELPAAPLPRAAPSGSDAFERCRRYVATMDPAVEHQGGNRRTFDVARRCVADFGLSLSDAWAVLVEYNGRCLPPWSERELRKILSDASTKARVANPK
jgi:hypothetical protein